MNNPVESRATPGERRVWDGREPTERFPDDAVGRPNCAASATNSNSKTSVTTDLTIAADGGRRKQLLENLFRNAIERIDDGFSVVDNGGGIPSGERPKVFESGYSMASDGTGLGLVIVEQFAQAHGWEVGIADTAGCNKLTEFAPPGGRISLRTYSRQYESASGWNSPTSPSSDDVTA